MNIDEQVYFEDFFSPGKTNHPEHEAAALYSGDVARRTAVGLFTLSDSPKRSFDDLIDKEVKDACFTLAELPLEEKIPYILKKTGLEGLFGERERKIGGKVYRYGLPLAKAPYEESEGELFLPPKLQISEHPSRESDQNNETTPKYVYWGGAGEEVNRFFFRQYKAYHYHEQIAAFELLWEGCDGSEKELLLIRQQYAKLAHMAAELKERFPELAQVEPYDTQLEGLAFPSNAVDWSSAHAAGMFAALCRMQEEYLPTLERQLEADQQLEEERHRDALQMEASYTRAHYLVHSGLFDIVYSKIGSQLGVAKLMAPMVGCSYTTLRQYLIRIEKGFDEGAGDALFYPANLGAAIQLLKAAGNDTSGVEGELKRSELKYGKAKGGRRK